MRTAPFGLGTLGFVLFLATSAAPQTPPAPQAPARQTPPAAQRRPRPAANEAQVVVRDQSGTPLEGVRIVATGGTRLTSTTDASGAAALTLPPGSYRLRFEHEGYVTLERDVTLRAAPPKTVVTVALDAAPPPPPPPPPPPAPAPTPAAPTPRNPVGTATATNISIPAFLDKNYIGRDPLKESVLACTDGATARVLQLRDPLASHTHPDYDEILYVVAGTGSVHVRDDVMNVGPGSLVVIPRGLPHSIARSGSNPLMLLSTVVGAPCRATPNAQLSGGR